MARHWITYYLHTHVARQFYVMLCYTHTHACQRLFVQGGQEWERSVMARRRVRSMVLWVHCVMCQVHTQHQGTRSTKYLHGLIKHVLLFMTCVLWNETRQGGCGQV